MSITYAEAVDEMFALVQTTVVNDTSAIIGYELQVEWVGVENETPLDLTKYWIRVSENTVTEEQATLRNGSFKTRYETDGLIIVQLFCPKSDAQAMEKGRSLAMLLRNTFRGKSTDCVWFRNSRINNLPAEDNWLRFNIISEYEYDELA